MGLSWTLSRFISRSCWSGRTATIGTCSGSCDRYKELDLKAVLSNDVTGIRSNTSCDFVWGFKFLVIQWRVNAIYKIGIQFFQLKHIIHCRFTLESNEGIIDELVLKHYLGLKLNRRINTKKHLALVKWKWGFSSLSSFACCKSWVLSFWNFETLFSEKTSAIWQEALQSLLVIWPPCNQILDISYNSQTLICA